MKNIFVKMTITFRMKTDADSHSDADHDALSYINEHIMDDEDQSPLTINIDYDL